MLHKLKTILHPTDFSDASAHAFAHALRIALATKGELFLVHADGYLGEQDEFPRVRHALAQWRLLDEEDPPAAVGDKLGIKVAKIGVESENPESGLLRFLEGHPSDLIVLATHGRDGLKRWVDGSVAEALSRAARLPTLFLSPTARGFVDQVSGALDLSRVLIPIDHSASGTQALEATTAFLKSLGKQDVTIELMHVGEVAPIVRREVDGTIVPVALRSGDVVSTILRMANDQQVDLLVMATAGHHGILDAIRGSTTERVLRHAPCPVLAVPAR